MTPPREAAPSLQTPPTEPEIADIITGLNACGLGDKSLVIRRLAFQRDQLRAAVNAYDPEALARLTAENARLRAALGNVQMSVAYIVTHATLARATREIEEGPRVQSPTVAEVWELINEMGNTARAALAGTP